MTANDSFSSAASPADVSPADVSPADGGAGAASLSPAAATLDVPPAAAARGRLRVDLPGSGLLPPLPDAFLRGEDLDLLAPVSFLAPGAALPARSASAAPPDRSALAAGLADANRAYGHPRADELAAKLARPGTRVVVAGQQPGLLGGPLYTFSKLLAVARWAAALEEAGEEAVGVFWVATEDHDFHEVARATVLAPGGPLEIDLGEDPEPLAPVGARTLGPEVEPALAALREAMPGDRYGEWLDRLAAWYRPDARFGEAFCRLMAHLAGDRCPLLLDAMLPAVKTAEQPWLARLVERRDAAEAAFAGADAAIEERGHPLQVHPQRGVSPLFLHARAERRRIAWADGDRFELRGGEGAPRPVAELLETIAENPVAVSPGVLARPVIQDAILGTDLMLLGPGELSYMPQVAPLYDVLGVAAPHVALRPQVLIVEPHQVDKMAEAEVTLAQLLAPEEALERVLAAGADGDFTARPRARLEEVLADLDGPALALDPNLERPLEKTRDQVLRAFDAFAGKVRSSAARRDEVRSGRVGKLRDAVLPGGKLQERVVASAHYPGKYGADAFTDAVWEQMELDGAILQVVTP